MAERRILVRADGNRSAAGARLRDARGDSPFFNARLPQSSDGANVVVISSFGGDGVSPLVGGYDAQDNLVAIHIDFIGSAEDYDDEDENDG